LSCATVDEVCAAIQSLAVRGAPALGATGAFGVALAARTETTPRAVRAACRKLAGARPTAVNLAVGVERALTAWEAGGADAALAEARRIADEDLTANRAMGQWGAELVGHDARVLTHCNTGSLATVQYGTALGVVRAAAELGQHPFVWVDETRPVLQGARLTAWELDRLGIPARLVVDGMAGALMAAGEVDLVIVGADRIAANGDVANKIGTYSLAVLAHHHKIEFAVAAPTSTIDLGTASGAAIPVEERAGTEVTTIGGVEIAPPGFEAFNQAFDVTPAGLVTAIVTEVGVLRPPYRRTLRTAVRAAERAKERR
jgi:methylthioribose-1-phosphate isomerase